MDGRQFRILVAVVAVSGMIGGALVSWVLHPAPAWAAVGDVVTCKVLRILDDDGRTIAELSDEFYIADSEGTKRLRMYFRDEKGRFEFKDAEGTITASYQEAGILLNSGSGSKRVTLIGGTNNGELKLFKGDGQEAYKAPPAGG